MNKNGRYIQSAKKEFSIKFWVCDGWLKFARGCIPSSRRNEVKSARSILVFGICPWNWQRPLKCHKWSQMSVHRGGCAEIAQYIVRRESVEASVYKSTQFELDTIWHLESVQLSSHNVEAAERVRRQRGRTVTFRAGSSDGQPGVRYSNRVDSGVDQSPKKRVGSKQHPSSGNVWWCVTDVASIMKIYNIIINNE